MLKSFRLFFLGSDDFPAGARTAAARALNETLVGEWPGLEVEARLPLASIAEAHETVERHRVSGRVVVTLEGRE